MTDTFADIEDDIKADFTALYNKIQGNTVVKTVETDVKVAGSASLAYIETNGLQDVYQIALTEVANAASGASWSGILASIEAQALADGKTLVSGASAVLASLAQADLISLGKLIPPASTPAA